MSRVAVVTGGTRGIGAAISKTLKAAGYKVAANYAGNDEAAQAFSRETGIPAFKWDVSSYEACAAGLAKVEAELGPIEVLVNNAGCTLGKAAVDVTWSEWDQVMDVNLKGGYFLSARMAARCMAEQRPGAIISVASTHGLVGIADRSVYSISKGGIVQMTRALAIEWAKAGIRVNAVAPGTVLTPSRARMLAEPARRQRMLDRIPIGRFPSVEEVAAAIAYLASPAAASVTGQILPVDGGLTAY
jgi:NAD(P)-dependent dehydrogenase (short-subunit alcohol dehydrogenase family)